MAEPLFTKILVLVDFSPCSEEAFRVASTMARTFQAKMVLLHVIDTGALATFNQLGLLAVPSDAQGQKRRLRHHARLNVRRLLESESAKGMAVTRVVLEGAPFVEIAKTARMEKVDLVVMGSYGGGVRGAWTRFFSAARRKRWCGLRAVRC
jgi:nucleotide-binding universal stress UspA family protein